MQFLSGVVVGMVVLALVKYFWPQEKQIALSEYEKLKAKIRKLEGKA